MFSYGFLCFYSICYFSSFISCFFIWVLFLSEPDQRFVDFVYPFKKTALGFIDFFSPTVLKYLFYIFPLWYLLFYLYVLYASYRFCMVVFSQLNLIDILIFWFFKKSRIYILFKCSCSILYDRPTYLDTKQASTNFKRMEIFSSIFSIHNGMKLEVNHTKK